MSFTSIANEPINPQSESIHNRLSEPSRILSLGLRTLDDDLSDVVTKSSVAQQLGRVSTVVFQKPIEVTLVEEL
jgi:hypothetical protein